MIVGDLCAFYVHVDHNGVHKDYVKKKKCCGDGVGPLEKHQWAFCWQQAPTPLKFDT